MALAVQLAASSWGILAAVQTADPADAFGEHALCLAGGGTPAAPVKSDRAPVGPTHHHAAYCCLWHALAGNPPSAFTVAAIEQGAAAALIDPATPGPAPKRPPGAPGARAPPNLA